MAFLGELDDIGVADLLYLLALRRQTGKLAISANGDEVSLYLKDGQMVVVTSSTMTLRLGRMLTRLRYLSPDGLRHALQLQALSHTGKPLGAILIDGGFITEAQLTHCVEEQCVEILARVIGAEQGIFVFHRGVNVHKRIELVPLNSDRILLEASSRSDELAALRAALPNPSAPLTLSPTIDDAAEELSDVEVLVVAALEGRPQSLLELAPQLNLPELSLWRTIVRMRERGLILTGADALSGAEPAFV